MGLSSACYPGFPSSHGLTGAEESASKFTHMLITGSQFLTSYLLEDSVPICLVLSLGLLITWQLASIKVRKREPPRWNTQCFL